MACNCGNNHPIIGPGHDCHHINHALDPNPPAFYGTWKPGDCSGKSSTVANPGVSTGLYKCGGPLHCSCGKAGIYNLIGVDTAAKIILEVKLSYANSSMNKTILVQPGFVYSFDYLENGMIKHCTGLVTNIYKVEQLEPSTDIYKIRVDCSANYSNNVVVFKSDQLRGVEKYNPNANADKNIKNATNMFGTTIGIKIEDAVVIDAELDKNKNIVKGKIIAGKLDGTTMDGVISGLNKDNIMVVMTGGKSTGGNIAEGYLLNGMASGDIEGDVDEDTGYITHATIKGKIIKSIIINSVITGATVDSDGNQNAVILPDEFTNTEVFDAVVSGEDMVTTGGITVGDITTGGLTTGGTAIGGFSTVVSEDGTRVHIQGGTTRSPANGKMETTNGVLVGGVVTGGTRVGNVVYNATITGGVVHDGVTNGGNTTYDYSQDKVVPANTAKEDPYGRIVYDNPNWAQVDQVNKYYRRKINRYDDLILMTDKDHMFGDLDTNFGTAVMERVNQDQGRTVR